MGMPPGGAGQPDDGIRGDADEASRLSDAIVLGQVIEDGDGSFVGESAAVEGRALALGEAGAAGVAVKQPELFLLAIAAADREVAGVASAVERAIGVLAAEADQVVHGAGEPGGPGQDAIKGWERKMSHIPTSSPLPWFNSPATPPAGASPCLG